jgi:hypothetical protein
LDGNVNNVTIEGSVLGFFRMSMNGNDVKMGDVHGVVTIGSSSAHTIHDFTAGEIFPSAQFRVFASFHDGTLGPEDTGSFVEITGPHHSLTTRT